MVTTTTATAIISMADLSEVELIRKCLDYTRNNVTTFSPEDVAKLTAAIAELDKVGGA